MLIRAVVIGFLLVAVLEEDEALFGSAIAWANKASVHLKSLSKNVQAAANDVKELAKLTVDEVTKMPLDVLATGAAAAKMTAKNFERFVPKIKDAASSVVEHLFEEMNPEAIKENLPLLRDLPLAGRQLIATAKGAIKAIGKDVSSWTQEQFRSLGNLSFGLTSDELKEVGKDTFENAINFFNELEEKSTRAVKFSTAQVQGLAQSAKNAWGDVSQWNTQQLQKLGALVTRLPVQAISKLNADAVVEMIDDGRKVFDKMSFVKKGAVLSKLKSKWGDISQWGSTEIGRYTKICRPTQFECNFNVILRIVLTWQ